ncbi:transcription initiation factor IID, 31kD subunit-domain-containing protein [Xylariaceae sp. FL0016]|nr:transcription initiation factor IID, 31kD subunit-domain-containing protein [Xylariaceae sp. FL0016]
MASSQTNGVPPSSAPSQPTQNTVTSSGSTTVPNTQASSNPATGANPNASYSSAATAAVTTAPTSNNNPPSSPTHARAPLPRDARTIELLLTAQGVTSWDSRVPLLLLDFAYRHTSSILNDALHLAQDPYTTQAGAKPSGTSGAVPNAPSNSDATVSASAVNVAIASRQAFQFRGGAGAGGTGGGGASKEWLADLARERNKVQLPRLLQNEWGVRLPNERFVLSGSGWSLKESWEGAGDDEISSDEDDDLMEGADGGKKKDGSEKKGDGEGGEDGRGLDEMLGDDIGDEDMEGLEE